MCYNQYQTDKKGSDRIMIEDARKRISQLKNIHDDIVAFTINKGERFSESHIIYDSKPELKIS